MCYIETTTVWARGVIEKLYTHCCTYKKEVTLIYYVVKGVIEDIKTNYEPQWTVTKYKYSLSITDQNKSWLCYLILKRYKLISFFVGICLAPFITYILYKTLPNIYYSIKGDTAFFWFLIVAVIMIFIMYVLLYNLCFYICSCDRIFYVTPDYNEAKEWLTTNSGKVFTK